jgi:CheY-like chemotaxis protein
MPDIDCEPCALCGKTLAPDEIDSGKAMGIGSVKGMRWACQSHFYMDQEGNSRSPLYRRNLAVMAMAVVWAERRLECPARKQMSKITSLFNKRALVVEDHEECAKLFKMILEYENWQVECVESGSEALRVLTSHYTGDVRNFDPDVMLLDLWLPDMTGVEVVQQLRKRRVKVPPTIIVTADSPGALNEATSIVGAVGIRKPFDFEDLFSAIAAAMTRTKMPPNRNVEMEAH